MAKTYTAAGSATAGQVYTASAHNVIVEDVNNLIVPPLCRVRRATTQSIANATDTFVSWTIEDIDTDGMFTATSDTITIQTAGVYLVTATVNFASNATGWRVLNIFKNPSSVSDYASAIAAFWLPDGDASLDTFLSASSIASFDVGQTVKVAVAHTAGISLNIGGGSFTSATHCSVSWLGRTT